MLSIKSTVAQAASAILWTASLTACSGTPVPQTQLTEAKVSTSAADAVGARTEPSASLHLKMAEDAIAAAEKFIADGKNAEALALLERATADAEVARTMAEAAVVEAKTIATTEKLETLRSDVGAQGGKS